MDADRRVNTKVRKKSHRYHRWVWWKYKARILEEGKIERESWEIKKNTFTHMHSQVKSNISGRGRGRSYTEKRSILRPVGRMKGSVNKEKVERWNGSNLSATDGILSQMDTQGLAFLHAAC